MSVPRLSLRLPSSPLLPTPLFGDKPASKSNLYDKPLPPIPSQPTVRSVSALLHALDDQVSSEVARVAEYIREARESINAYKGAWSIREEFVWKKTQKQPEA